MSRFFSIYQYLSPAILLPISYYLWLQQLHHDHRLVWFTLSMPILFAYINPAIGTNYFKLWKFNARWKLGHFLPHHGLIFGGSISLIALVCLGAPPVTFSLFELARAGFITGSVLAFWNWLFDIYALQAGFFVVYNQPYYQNQGPEAIATDYCPVYFGVFGLCYGLALYLGQYYLLSQGRWELFGPLLLVSNLVAVLLPAGAFMLFSYVKHGSLGLRPFTPAVLEK